MARAPTDIRSLARKHTTLAINTLAAIARRSKSDTARVQASSYLIERGWGKAIQPHAGEDGEGPIVVEIINKVREKKK